MSTFTETNEEFATFRKFLVEVGEKIKKRGLDFNGVSSDILYLKNYLVSQKVYLAVNHFPHKIIFFTKKVNKIISKNANASRTILTDIPSVFEQGWWTHVFPLTEEMEEYLISMFHCSNFKYSYQFLEFCDRMRNITEKYCRVYPYWLFFVSSPGQGNGQESPSLIDGVVEKMVLDVTKIFQNERGKVRKATRSLVAKHTTIKGTISKVELVTVGKRQTQALKIVLDNLQIPEVSQVYFVAKKFEDVKGLLVYGTDAEKWVGKEATITLDAENKRVRILASSAKPVPPKQ